MEDPQTDLRINTEGPLTVLEACRRYNPGAKVLCASTRQVYKPLHLPVDGDSPAAADRLQRRLEHQRRALHRLYSAVPGCAPSACA